MTKVRNHLEASVVWGLSLALVLAAHLKWLPIDTTEALGFATGAICVWLVTRANAWSWPIGLVNNIFFAVLFWRTRLYADMGLQVVYFALGLYGWWLWVRGGVGRTPVPISRTKASEWMSLFIIMLTGVPVLRWILVEVNGAAPFWDATTTVISLCAQYLLCRKRIENWLVWIAVDIIYIPLYLSRGLPLTAALYAIFLAMCVIGLRRWERELRP